MLLLCGDATTAHQVARYGGPPVGTPAHDQPLPALTLGDFPVGTFHAPALVTPGQAPPPHRHGLRAEQGGWALPLQPLAQPDAPAAPAGPAAGELQIEVDCTTTRAALSGVQATLDCADLPARWLWSVACRPRVLATVPAAGDDPDLHVEIDVPALSQLSGPEPVRRAICSPTCITMVLNAYGIAADLATVAAEVFDPVHRLYGHWPRNLQAASRRGLTGWLELATRPDDLHRWLDRGIPVIASIDFGVGELAGSPLRATGGHLVVVRGRRRDAYLVNDPAAEPHAVTRWYARDELLRAWLHRRGAAYILLPPGGPPQPSAEPDHG